MILHLLEDGISKNLIMINNLEDLAAAIGGGEDEKKVTNQQRQDFNNFVGWLDKRGMKGHPSLDKNNLGNNLLKTYIKENPNTSLTPDLVIPIQKDFANYRQWALNNIHSGKGEFAPGTDEHNFMKELSIVDGLLGQYTSRHVFPKDYMKTFEDGKLVGQEEKFATVQQPQP